MGLLLLAAAALFASTNADAQPLTKELKILVKIAEGLLKSPNCLPEEAIRPLIYEMENERNSRGYSDHDQGYYVFNYIKQLQKKICPPEPVRNYRVQGSEFNPPPALFEAPLPFDNEPSERTEIGASGRARTGPYLGIETLENFGRVRTTETFAATGATTFQSTDSGDPPGIGIIGGYSFRPWNNRIVIGPFASFDYLNQTINHNFAGGQFFGTTTHWLINAGVKAGVMTAPGFYLYGLAGAAFLNHDLNINFAAAALSNVTTPGLTLGLGGEYQPSSWRIAGHPVSVFAQYQHTWWSDANFNAPTSSPLFNYAFRREDDTIKLGVNFYFGAAPAPTSPPYPVKALPPK